MRTHVTLMLCVLLHLSFSKVDWCDYNCGSQKHVRCGYQLLESNELCNKIVTGMEPSERKDILDAHNRWRDFVASGNPGYFTPTTDGKPVSQNERNFTWNLPSSDMRQLTWDYDLERNAQIWVSQCNVKTYRPYNCARTEQIKVVHMNKYDDAEKDIIRGHLLANRTLSDFLHFMTYVDVYANRTEIVLNYQPGVYNTYYAMIFSKTTKLGCSKGICYCNQPEWPYGAAAGVTCIYGPSFDHTLSGYKIYENGKPCSACPEGTACKNNSAYPNLCARPDDPTQPTDIPANLAFPLQLPNVMNLHYVVILNARLFQQIMQTARM